MKKKSNTDLEVEKFRRSVDKLLCQLEQIESKLELSCANTRSWQNFAIVSAMQDAAWRLRAASAPVELIKRLELLIARTEADDQRDDYFILSESVHAEVIKFFALDERAKVN